MKQRLLLSLLMLFVSVGLVKAQTINITSTGEADAKVTLTSDAFTFVDVTNYPTYTGDGVTHKVTGKSVEYTIPKGKTTLAINTAANEWGNISIIVDGKVSSFALSEETALSKLITSLKFVNNGVLKGLTLGAGGGTMVYVPNLEYLDCQGNQLSRFPKMGEKMTAANYKIGEQTPSGVTLGTMDPTGWICLLIVGLLHTGVTYCLYFSALKELPGQKAAILSYIDPLTAVLVSVLVLRESISLWQAVGGALILGFTLWNEISPPVRAKS